MAASTSRHMSQRFILISGCSGGGKSTLLDELANRGYATVSEPGRRIVADELAQGGSAVPWDDMKAFAQRAVEMSIADLKDHAGETGFVFFDRGLLDAAVAQEFAGGPPFQTTLGIKQAYQQPVFLTPPWPEIYAPDAERRHDLASAIAEYDRLQAALCTLGYNSCLLPKTSVSARADFVLDRLGT